MDTAIEVNSPLRGSHDHLGRDNLVDEGVFRGGTWVVTLHSTRGVHRFIATKSPESARIDSAFEVCRDTPRLNAPDLALIA